MPNIPFDLADIGDLNANSLGGQRSTPQVGNQYIGRALGGISDALGQGAQTSDHFADLQRDNSAASITAASSFTPAFVQMKQNMPVDGAGFTEGVSQAYDQHVSNVTGNIADPIVRMSVRNNLLRQKESYVGEAAESAMQAQQSNAKTVASAGLSSALNDLSARPTDSQRAQTLTNGNAVIDSQPLPADTRAAMKLTFGHQVYFNQANSMLGAARGTADVGNFQRWLAQDDVRQGMAPQQYDTLTRLSYTRSRMFARRENMGLTAAATDMHTRAVAGIPVDPTEIKSIEAQPGLANNPRAQMVLADTKDILATRSTYANSSIADLNAAYQDAVTPHTQPGVPSYTQGLDPDTVSDINTAATQTGATPTFLSGMIHNEYGKYLATGDYSKGADNGGSAVGIAQMQPAAWHDMLAAHSDEFGAAMQPPISGAQLMARSPEELLALRTDRKLSLMGAGYYAAQNAATFRNSTGREPTDGDLYVMHMLGPTGGMALINAKDNSPDSTAGAVVSPGAIAGNAHFFQQNGHPLSCADAYNCITGTMPMNPYRVSAGRVQVLKSMVAQRAAQFNADPAQAAVNQGAQGMASLDNTPQSWAQRGQAITQFSQQQGTQGVNGRPLNAVKPLTNVEAQSISQQMQDPNTPAQTKMQTLMNVYHLGSPSLVQAGLRQIGEKDPVALYAARTANSGDTQTGYGIFTGRDMLNKNPALASALGLTDANIGRAFYSSDGVGDALAALPPDAGGQGVDQTVQTAAKMLYAFNAHGHGTQASGADGTGDINPAMWKAALNKVLGATPGHDAVQQHNGVPTLMPQGMDDSDVSDFFSRATPADIMRISGDGKMPVLPATSTHPSVPVTMRNLRNGILRATGGGYYTMMLSDGTQLSTGSRTGNGWEPFYFKLSADTMHKGATGLRAPVAMTSPYTGPKPVGAVPRPIPVPASEQADAPNIPNAVNPTGADLQSDSEDAQFAQEQQDAANPQ